MYWAAIANKTNAGDRLVENIAGVPVQNFMGMMVGYSPVAMALLLAFLSRDRCSWRWPFQKEPVFGAFGLFLVLGWAACIKPVHDATVMIC